MVLHCIASTTRPSCYLSQDTYKILSGHQEVKHKFHVPSFQVSTAAF